MTDPQRPMDLTCEDVRDLAASFVLDALEPDEMAAVRAHLAGHEDAHPEIEELASVLPVLAASVPIVEPSAGLKARVLAAAAADLETRDGETATTPATTAAEPVPFPSADERATRETRRGSTSAGTWLLRIAAVLAIALLGGWNLLLQGQLDGARTYQENVAAVLDAAGQPGSLTAILTSEDGVASGLAAIEADGTVTLAMDDLAPTTGNEVYETWVIAADGVPVPLGSFQVGTAGTGTFTATGVPTEPGIVLALTREPGPGATAPTLPIVSSGTATSAS